jgi:hypothetical protein
LLDDLAKAVPQPPEAVPTKAVVARTIATSPMCVRCLMTDAGLDLSAVLDALRDLEADVKIIRAWGQCPRCGEKKRTVLSIR